MPYKKNKTSWKKGTSGNPKGRPPKGETLKDRFEKLLNEEYVTTDKVTGEKKPTGFKKSEILAEAIFRFALSGSATHANIIYDRLYGRVPMRLESTGVHIAMTMTDDEYKAIMADVYARQKKWEFDENGNPIDDPISAEKRLKE